MQEHANGEITVDIRNRVAHLTLNRPHALNALSFDMILSLENLFTSWTKDETIKAIVMRGAGEKAFCAGGDIRALRDSCLSKGTLHHDFFIDEYRLDYQLHRYVKPVICLLDGIVMGGGMGIAQGSGFRIAGPKTKMAMPETGIGLFPDVGGSYFLSRSVAGHYLGLTGQMIRAADAIYANLADRFMTSETIATLVGKLDSHKWSAEPAADIAALIDAMATVPDDTPMLPPLQAAIDAHFAPQKSVAEMIASLEQETRADVAPWAAKTAAVLKTRSPTLLEVTRRQLNRGSRMSLAECFRMELGMVYHCFEHGDLMEGIRAVVIDKDNQPRWNPATLAAVDPEMVSAFFTPRWDHETHPLANLERLFG